MIKNTRSSYGNVAKIFHWLIGLAVIGMLILGLFLTSIKDEHLAGILFNLHKSTGLAILILVVLRVAWRFSNITPSPSIHAQPWQQKAERYTHFLMYLALFVMPLSGWAMSTAEGYIPSFYGYGEFAMPFIPKSKALADAISWVHTIAGYTLIALVSLHILATVQHYVVHKDNILKRML